MIFSKNNLPSGYYVYAYIRSKDSNTAKAGTPYYIGKGKGNRAYISHKRRNNSDLLPLDSNMIMILESNLTELGAFALERRLIRWYGCKDQGSGILQNIIEGGSGGCPKGRPSPTKGTKLTKEHKAKISAAGRGRKCPKSPEHRRKLSEANIGKKLSVDEKFRRAQLRRERGTSEETREKLRKANTGRIVSQETRNKISSSNMGKKKIQKNKTTKIRPPISDETRKKMSDSRKGIKRGPPSEETRQIWREQRKGRILTEEHKAKIAKASQNMSAETKAKLSAAGMGRVVSQETRDKIAAKQIGCKKSEEQKLKQSIAMSGRISGPMSEETKKKISEANKNASEETREKLRKSRLGKPMSEETKKKIGEANRQRNLLKKSLAAIDNLEGLA